MKIILRKEFIETIFNCQWLQRCGQTDNLEFDVEYLKNIRDVERNINSTKWENLCLDRMGDFTTYLLKNHKAEYNKYWNDGVRMIKEQYISKLSEKVNFILTNSDLSVDILDDIKMNILSIFMLEYYAKYYSSDFYTKMFKIYLAGHLPCGWFGEYPNGKFQVCITKISTFLILCDLAVCLATLYVSFSLVFALMRYLQGKVFLIRFYSPTTLSSSRAEFRLPSRLACA